MTCALALAVTEAEADIYQYDRDVDRYQLAAAVQRMTRTGSSASELGHHFRKSSRSIHRIRLVEVPEIPAHNPHVSDERAAELEATVKAAVDLSCRLRDENPRITWDALSKLDRQRLQELAVVLLAAVPIDRSITEMFAWVYPLGEDS